MKSHNDTMLGANLRNRRTPPSNYRMHPMLTMHTDILRLAERYAEARRIARSTLAREATGSSTWFERCADGRVTIRSAIAVVEWLSDRWPEGLAWPQDVAYPAPDRKAVGGVPNGASHGPENPGAASGASRAATGENGDGRVERCGQGTIPGATARPNGAGGQAPAAAMRLGRSGRVASPGDLCDALGVSRYAYDDVLRRYRDGTGDGRVPRPGSDCGRVLAALVASGDVRFASRREKSGTGGPDAESLDGAVKE